MINELIASVDKVLGQVQPDAPTSQPAPACECEAPATINFVGIDFCAECYDDYRRYYQNDAGRLTPGERGL